MVSVESKFNTVLDELNRPSSSHYAGDKQIYYITFPPDALLSVKKKTNTLAKLAEFAGWIIHPLSVAEVLASFFRANPYRDIWLEQEQYFDGLTIGGLFEDLGASIRNQRVIEQAILATQATIPANSCSLLLITDLECLHPYSRFGPIEQQIYGDLQVPLVVLYPGQLTGSSLDFLAIYPPDGSYRSKHL